MFILDRIKLSMAQLWIQNDTLNIKGHFVITFREHSHKVSVHVRDGNGKSTLKTNTPFFKIKNYIKILCLSGCLFVCQNGWSDRAQILCVTLHDPGQGLWMLKITKNCVYKLNLWNFEKIRKKLWKSANFFLFLVYSVQREDAHK